MTQANDSISITPGSGATVATHLISDKEHQVMIVADPVGRLLGSPLAIRTEETGSTSYYGSAAPGTAAATAAWRICRITETDTTQTVEWADGNANFDNVWANRASLSYS